MKVYNFYFGDKFIKRKICSTKKEAFIECRELEKDYKLIKYSVKCIYLKTLNADGSTKE